MTTLPAATSDRFKRDFQLLSRVSALFNAPQDFHAAANQAVQAIAEAMEAGVCFWLSQDHDGLLPIAFHDPDPEFERIFSEAFRFFSQHAQTHRTWQAFFNQEDVMIPFVQSNDEIDPEYLRYPRFHSYMSVRIKSRNQPQGMISLGSLNPERHFDVDDFALIQAIADQAANVLLANRYLDDEVKIRQRAETLLKVAKAMRSELDLPTVLQDALDVTWQFLRPSFAGIFLIDEREHFYLAASTEIEPARSDTRWTAREGLLSRILESASPTHLPQLQLEPMLSAEQDFFRPADSSCCSIIPMRYHGKPNGVLVLQWDAGDYQAEDDELLSGIAELVAMAIENQRLIQQEAVSHSEKMLAQLVTKEREVLIRQITHDLRNSTQTLSLINEEIEVRASGNPDLLFAVSAIDRQVSFLSNFLKKKLARLQLDPMGATPAAQLNQVVRQIAEDHLTHFLSRNQLLELANPSETIDLSISEADLTCAIENLLENARLYSPPGARIKLWYTLSDGWATLYVADDGPGIPKDQQSQIGERGFRGRPDVTGNGMGLAEVKRIVNENGGLFGFNSRPGSGATFYFMLPTTRWGKA